jgi:hypothetical protein
MLQMSDWTLHSLGEAPKILEYEDNNKLLRVTNADAMELPRRLLREPRLPRSGLVHQRRSERSNEELMANRFYDQFQQTLVRGSSRSSST